MELTITWLGIISFGLNLLLAGIGIYQFVSAKKEEENTKGRIRDWQNQAEGIKNALLSIAQNPDQFTEKKDIASAVLGVAQSAVTLDKVFVEERFYPDEEVKKKREEAEKETKALLEKYKNQ